MPDPITWGALAKAVGDNTIISDEIATLILNHNLDPSAHGQTSEAVYNHRIAELLDHVSYSIYNVKMNPAARIYKAIVGPGFEADFTTIQQAIDWAHLYGGGIVHVKAGTYVQTADITLYSDIILQGEDDDLSIIDFNDAAKRVIIQGTNGTHLKNVTLKDLCFKNSSYDGYMVEVRYADDFIVQDCKFDNDLMSPSNLAGHLSIFSGTNRTHIRRNRFLNGSHDLLVSSANYVWIEENFFYNNAGDCIVLGEPNHIVIHGNVFENTTTNLSFEGAIYSESICTDLSITENKFYHCGSQQIYLGGTNYAVIANNQIVATTGSYNGIQLVNCDKCAVTGNTVINCDMDGIFLTECDYNTIAGNVFSNCGAYGINVYDADCNKNVLVANSLLGNSSAAYNNGGTSTVIANNAF